jgi:hypothetical protein
LLLVSAVASVGTLTSRAGVALSTAASGALVATSNVPKMLVQAKAPRGGTIRARARSKDVRRIGQG